MAEIKIDVKPEQLYVQRGDEEPRTRWRVLFVGTDSVSVQAVYPSPDRRNTTKRVRLGVLAAEYDLIEEASR